MKSSEGMSKVRQDAWELVAVYTSQENLREHMLAVKAAMRAYARR